MSLLFFDGETGYTSWNLINRTSWINSNRRHESSSKDPRLEMFVIFVAIIKINIHQAAFVYVPPSGEMQ